MGSASDWETMQGAAETLVALKVESQSEYALAKQLGFDLFQGYYFAKPEVLSSRRANASHIALLRLQALLQADPGIHELEVELKLNPTVVMHLMRLVNSGAFGLRRNILYWIRLRNASSPRLSGRRLVEKIRNASNGTVILPPLWNFK